MSAVTLQGEIVHYEVLGRGRPLFFLHDWIGSWRYWIPTMQTASVAFRAYALDLWGFGDTNKNPDFYALEQQIGLLNGFMDMLGIGKIALVGHGLGAVIALVYTARHPEIVDRVMVTGLPLNGSAISPRLRELSPSELAEWLLGRLPTTETVRVEASKIDPRAILASLDGMQVIDPLELVKTANRPCLLVHGQNDPMVEISQWENLPDLPEHVHTVIFEQSGHFPMLDESNKYNRLLSDFLALNSGESPRQLQLKEEWKRRVR